MSLSKIKQDIEQDGARFDLHAWHAGPSNIIRMLAVAVNPQLVTTDFRSYFETVSRIASICGESHSS